MRTFRIVTSCCSSVLALLLCNGAVAAQINASDITANAHRVATVGPYMGLHGSSVSADGRYLAYTDWTTGDLALFDLVEATHRRVTNKGPLRKVLEFAESFVRFSHDGRRLAYVWDRNGYELWTADIDGSNRRFVYRNDPGRGEVQVFDLSPGGKSVVAVVPKARSDSQSNALRIALIHLDNASIQLLKDLSPRSRISAMAFSPDGRFVAYDIASAANARKSDIYVLAIDGRDEIALTTDSAANQLIGWTPDGEGILFAADRGGTREAWFQPFKARAPQHAPQRVLTNLPADFRPLGFTRDGALYYATSAASTNDVFTATADASRSSLVRPPSSASFGAFANEGPDWSPDGRQLAFVRNGETIVIRSIDGDTVRELTPRGMQRIFTVASGDRYLRWSPDGRKMLAPENRTIFLVDVTTGVATPAVTDRRSRFGRWSPDGRAIYYSRQVGANDSPFEIVRWKIEANVKDVLYRSNLPGDNVGSLELSPDGRWLAFSDIVLDSAGYELGVLRVMPSDSGVARTLLTAEPSEEVRVVGWTPDANKILITRYDRLAGDRGTAVWLVSPLVGEPEALELGRNVLTHLRFHPNGRRIAFDSGRRGAEIWVIPNVRGQATKR